MSSMERVVYLASFGSRQSRLLDHNQSSMGPIWGQCGTVHGQEFLICYRVQNRSNSRK